MASKQQCLNALAKIHQDAELSDESGAMYFDVQITAPIGMNWGDLHSIVVSEHMSISKAQFWDYVLEEIKALEAPEQCTVNTCSAWEKNECTVWGELLREMQAVDIELGKELIELYKVVEFPCSDEEEKASRERISELEALLK